VVRRITIRLDQPTRSGETEIHLLTNLPRRAANACRVAELYLKRWTIENAFQEIEQALRSEINTLGYPGAALLGFAIAVLTYNALSVAKWAIEIEHADSISREQLSGYYLAAVVSADYGGMIALPEGGVDAPLRLAHAKTIREAPTELRPIRSSRRVPQRRPRTQTTQTQAIQTQAIQRRHQPPRFHRPGPHRAKMTASQG
jgi:hypothetical protein